MATLTKKQLSAIVKGMLCGERKCGQNIGYWTMKKSHEFTK
jgi:hypothetical protein